jgi:hypothetical protein
LACGLIKARRRIPWNQLSWNDDLVGGFLV